MIKNVRNITEIQRMAHSVDYSVHQPIFAKQLDVEPAVGVEVANLPPRIPGVEDIHALLTGEMRNRPPLPNNLATDEIYVETLPEEIDSNVFLGHDDAVHIGVLAVRLVASWRLPRLKLRPSGEEEADGLSTDYAAGGGALSDW